MFALDLARVPRCEARLRTFQLKFTALETLQEAKQILQGHSAAAEEIQSSMCENPLSPVFLPFRCDILSLYSEAHTLDRCFAEVLQVALGAGNFLNWGTARGQAAGFRLRGLNKLQVSLPVCTCCNSPCICKNPSFPPWLSI
jgi:hypothetical protein